MCVLVAPEIRTSCLIRTLLFFCPNAIEVCPEKSGHLSNQDTLSRSQKCPHLGVLLNIECPTPNHVSDCPDHYQLSVEGACLSTLREGGDSGASEVVRVNKAGLNYLTDSHILADQGPEPIALKPNLSFRMQGISTSRILALRSGY